MRLNSFFAKDSTKTAITIIYYLIPIPGSFRCNKLFVQVDDYLDVIKEPMDLSTVMTRINSHHYHSCAHYLKDIDLIVNNCLEYNPDKDQFDKLLRNRACEMRDVAHALIHNDLDPDFEKVNHIFLINSKF